MGIAIINITLLKFCLHTTYEEEEGGKLKEEEGRKEEKRGEEKEKKRQKRRLQKENYDKIVSFCQKPRF